MLGGLAVLVVGRLFNTVQTKRGSWARRGLYALLLLLIARAFLNRNRR
jgi:hypothetical protein